MMLTPNTRFFVLFLSLSIALICSANNYIHQPIPLLRTLDGKTTFHCRNVPGEGSCLFHSIATCLAYRQSKQHIEFNSTSFKELSIFLRNQAIRVLQDDNRILTLEDGVQLSAKELLEMTAAHYNTTVTKYCEMMKLESTWGGGPEIVALANDLECPIHVYELAVKGFLRQSFRIKLMAKIGTTNLDTGNEPLCILCADGRFPHIAPGEQKPLGDHFLALFVANSLPSPSDKIDQDPGASNPWIINLKENFWIKRFTHFASLLRWN